jgi:hypothetical protein
MIGQLSSLVGGEVGTRVYGLLNRVQIWRVCAVFFSGSLPSPYFFCFLACSLHSITQKSIEHRIGCNCGAFAPYFFYFSLAAPWSGTTPQMGAEKIGCNCGAFAPYFFQVRFLLCRICQIGCWLTPGRPLAPIRLANAGSCPSRQRDCVASAARSAETKGTAQLVLRTQARRKEEGPHLSPPPLPPLQGYGEVR